MKVSRKSLKRKTVVRVGARGSSIAKAAARILRTGVGKPNLKIRVGIIWGKDFDPVKIGTQCRNYPEKCRWKKPAWGGQFHIDVNTGCKMEQLHPDVFEIVPLTKEEITPAALKKNHINFSFWTDPATARRSARDLPGKRGPQHVKNVDACYKDPECRLWPNWEFSYWIAYKPLYMRQLEKFGVPIIPTIFLDNGFQAKAVLKQVQARGWDKFFAKVGFAAFFGEGAINGNTADFVAHPEKLEQFEEETRSHKCFLVQPYMLKPNGEVFDEIRNYFVNGVWHTAVFTHGTDMSNAGYYEEPQGKRLDLARELATKAYDVVKKCQAAKWQGRPIDTLMTRVDIGVIPDKTAKFGWRVFVNEVEPDACTWLARYWPTDCTQVMGRALVEKTRELLKISLESGQRVPDAANVRRQLQVLEERLK